MDIPVIYEDEGQEEMGETQIHTATNDIIFYGVKAHLAAQPRFRVFSNLDCIIIRRIAKRISRRT